MRCICGSVACGTPSSPHARCLRCGREHRHFPYPAVYLQHAMHTLTHTHAGHANISTCIQYTYFIIYSRIRLPQDVQENASEVWPCWLKLCNKSTSKAIAFIRITKRMVRQAVVGRRKPNMPEFPRPPALQEATAHPTPSSGTSIEAATLSYKLEYPPAIAGIQHWQSPMFTSQAKRRQSLGPQRYRLRVEITTGGVAPEVFVHSALFIDEQKTAHDTAMIANEQNTSHNTFAI